MKEALKLALEALEGWDRWSQQPSPETKKAITAIKQALATPVQEPVYHLRQFGDVTKEQLDRYMATGDINPQPAPVQERNFCERCGKRLGGEGDIHTCTPPAEPVYVKTFHGGKPWPLQPAPVQEPVAGVVLRDGYPTLVQDKHVKETDQRLYTTPPTAQRAWVGLTDEEWLSLGCNSVEEVRIGLAIQAKLKEKNT
jgi:hypothetical protein